MSGTTNINDLPISPQTDSMNNETTSNNITFNTFKKNTVIDDPIKNLTKQREMDDKQISSMHHDNNVQNGSLPPIQSGPSNHQQNHNNSNNNNKVNMNEFVNGIQEAASKGALGLPSRDIPQTQTHITQDVSTKPNYVPEGPDDYILRHQSQEEIINAHSEKEKKAHSIDNIYDELQGPILVAALYFVFQMPVLKKQLMAIVPSLFFKDGNLNLSGYITYSILFSGAYYASMRTINYLSI